MDNQPHNTDFGLFVDSKLMNMVQSIEIDVNTRRRPSKLIAEYEDELNEYFFTTEASKTQRILGMAALGTLSNNTPTMDDHLADFVDVTIRGFEIHRTLPEVERELSRYEMEKYHAYLKFDTYVAESPYLRRTTPSYFMRPNNILSMYDSPQQIMNELRRSLHQNTQHCYAELAEFELVPAEHKDTILHRLAETSGDPFMRRYGGHEVSVDAPLFYRVEYDENGPWINRNKFSPLQNNLIVDKYPTGIATTCLFIEHVLYPRIPAEQRHAEPLIINEPCIALRQDDTIRYLIPISQVRDVFMM